MAKSKTCEKFEIDGHIIEFTQIERWRHRWVSEGNPDGHPKERTRWEIRVDGALVGYARRPYGWGKQALLVDALWETYSYGFGETEFLKAHHANKNYDLADLAPLVLGWRFQNAYGHRRLMTTEEIAIATAEYEEKERKRRADEAAREATRKKEQEEKETAAKVRKDETLEGLESIRTRLGTTLTNSETEMLQRAIDTITRRGL
jgi:hypothetical protein